MNIKTLLILAIAAAIVVGCESGDTPTTQVNTATTKTTKNDTTNANIQNNSKIPDSAKKAMHFGGGGPPAGAPAGN